MDPICIWLFVRMCICPSIYLATLRYYVMTSLTAAYGDVKEHPNGLSAR